MTVMDFIESFKFLLFKYGKIVFEHASGLLRHNIISNEFLAGFNNSLLRPFLNCSLSKKLYYAKSFFKFFNYKIFLSLSLFMYNVISFRSLKRMSYKDE
jgi:hypothetical protein